MSAVVKEALHHVENTSKMIDPGINETICLPINPTNHLSLIIDSYYATFSHILVTATSNIRPQAKVITFHGVVSVRFVMKVVTFQGTFCNKLTSF